MPVFGQVWLWSLAGFLVGALLCWALVARPARRRAIELEDRIDELRRTRQEPVATAYQPSPFDDFDGYQREDNPRGEFQPDDHSRGDFPSDDHSRGEFSSDDQSRGDFPSDDHSRGQFRSDDHSHGEFPSDDRGRTDAEPADDLTAPPEAGPQPHEPPPVAEPAQVESTQLMAAPPVAEHPPVEAPPEVEPEWYPVAERFDVSRLDAAESPDDEHLVDDLPADEPDSGTIFTQHTTPISGALIRRLDDDTSLVDDLADDSDDIDPHRGHFADALTPDDEEDQLRTAEEDQLRAAEEDQLRAAEEDRRRAAEDEPATRYLPAVPNLADTPPVLSQRHTADTEALPRRASTTDADQHPSSPDADALPQRDSTEALRGGSVDADPLPQRGSYTEALPKRESAEVDALPKRSSGDADVLPKRTSGDGDGLPKRTSGDGDGLPKRVPGGESRRPVGEATAFSPSPSMFTPAEPDTDRARHSLPPGPASEPTVYSPPVRPEPAAARTSTELAARTEPAGRSRTESEPAARSRTESEPAGRSRTESEPAARTRTEPEPTVFAPSVPEPVVEEAPRTGALPKRVPKKPGDRFPFGVRTGAADPAPAPTATAEPTPDAPAEPERSRSLFEPITPADEPGATKALPAPSRPKRGASRPSQVLPGGVDTFVPPGPFGPGSAMPLPGGNSPSSEYRVKASVTALRYCSPESPKFDRTVAEVWFRSVADAERVGFRPLG